VPLIARTSEGKEKKKKTKGPSSPLPLHPRKKKGKRKLTVTGKHRGKREKKKKKRMEGPALQSNSSLQKKKKPIARRAFYGKKREEGEQRPFLPSRGGKKSTCSSTSFGGEGGRLWVVQPGRGRERREARLSWVLRGRKRGEGNQEGQAAVTLIRKKEKSTLWDSLDVPPGYAKEKKGKRKRGELSWRVVGGGEREKRAGTGGKKEGQSAGLSRP